MIERFTLVLSLALALLASAPAASAQQARQVYRISFLALLPDEDVTLIRALRERLHELGHIEGQNLIFDFRSADGHHERLSELAMELARARPDVLIAGSGTLAPLALKAATASIPIVFVSVGDPVRSGLVASLGRPGSNITGLTGQSTDLAGKRLQLLWDLIPRSRLIAVLMNPATPFTPLALKETRAVAEGVNVDLKILEITTRDQVADRFEAARKAGAGGMIVFADPLTYELRRQISDVAARFRLPTIYTYREYVEAGGLISYGPSRRAMYRRAAEYVDKILKGTKPADLPVEQPTKFELVINMKTAKALALTIPTSLLARADHVVE